MKNLILILALFSVHFCEAQKQYSKAEMIGYNICFSALNAGLSRALHKSHKESFKDAFFDGLWKGAIGGTIN